MTPIAASDGHRKPPCRGARNMKLLTVQEVAETMKVSEKTVRRLIKRGDLAAYKVGERGQLRVKECDLKQYVEAKRVQVEGAAEANASVTESGE
jgi:putative molybdopterin biosynthesis protein